MRHFEDSENCNRCGGEIDARGRPIPANLEALFPDPSNADTWNLAALSPIVRFYTIGVGTFPNQYAQPKVGAWAQDDWQIARRVTLNLGVRYDLSLNAWANDIGVEPFFRAGRPNDTNNVQPRLGFCLAVERPDGGARRVRRVLLGRNSFIQPAQNKTDVRVQQWLPQRGRAAIDLIGEVFNVFNRSNHTRTTQESSANYGKPDGNQAQYRTAQVGFRLTF